VIRQTIPADEIDIVLDNLGLPAGGINLAFSDASLVASADGRDTHLPQAEQVDHGLRRETTDDPRRTLPGSDRLLPAGDIVSQILNSAGCAHRRPDRRRDPRTSGSRKTSFDGSRRSPGRPTSGCSRCRANPEFDVDVDRWMARQLGFTESNVAQSMLVSLSAPHKRSRTTGST